MISVVGATVRYCKMAALMQTKQSRMEFNVEMNNLTFEGFVKTKIREYPTVTAIYRDPTVIHNSIIIQQWDMLFPLSV